MKKNIALLKDALVQSQRLAGLNPDVPILRSLEPQLRFVLDLLEGKHVDRSRLSELTIGIIVVREVEDRDPGLADLLYQVTGLVQDIRFSSQE